jgi:asparagine synthase (glutamine-hydrolysing)
VRPEDRVTPWRYKPLIVEAMRGIVPEGSRTRQTKANGSTDVEPGLRRHRAELLALWEDSRLAAAGLVDAAALREACTRPLPPELQFGVLDQLVACEVWLRSLEPVTAPN